MNYYSECSNEVPAPAVASCNAVFAAPNKLLSLAGRAGVKDKLHHDILNGTNMRSFASQVSTVSKLLLGQNLLSNNGLFSKEIIIKSQNDDKYLSGIIVQLKSDNPVQNSKFILKNEILFKIQALFGNSVH